MKIQIKISQEFVEDTSQTQTLLHLDDTLSHHLDEVMLTNILYESRLQEWNQDPNKGKVLGQQLWQVFNGSDQALQKKVEEAYQKGESLHLYIQLPDELEDLPLELLYHQNFLLLKGETHLFRQVLSKRNEQNQKVPEERPLSLLFMAASPQELEGSTLNFEKEEEQIFAQTETLALELYVEETGCLSGLEEQLMDIGSVDVIHLSGHAGIDAELDPVFYLEDEAGSVDKVSPESLWKTIQNFPPRLLFLSGCETGKHTQGHSATSFAKQMVKLGCPAVLGWGLKVSDQGATQMTAAIYNHLAQGLSLDIAILRARQSLEKDYHPWPLLRYFGDASPISPLIAPGQKKRRRPRKSVEVIRNTLEDSDVVVLRKGFVGRRRQIQKGIRILRAYDYDTYGFLITGPAGVGKSALAGRIIERFPTRKLLVFSRKLSEGQLFTRFREVFEKEGYQDGMNVFNNPDLDYSGKVKALFRTVFKEQDFIIYWDNFEDNLEQRANQHYLRAESAQVISPFLEALDWAEGATSLMISSRYPFALEMNGKDYVHNKLEEIPLASMRGAVLKKKQERLPHMNGSKHTELYLEIGKGNPRLLEWLEEIAQREKELDLEKLREALEAKSEEYRSEYLAKILAQTEGEEFLSFLKKASVYRKPEPANAYEGIGDTRWLSVAQGLTLMESDKSGGEARYWVHPVLQTQFWEDLEEEEQQNLHLIALDYYEALIKEATQLDKWPSYHDCKSCYFHATALSRYERTILPIIYIAKFLESALLYKESNKILENTFNKIRNIYPPILNQNNDLIILINNLAHSYRVLGDFQKAVEPDERVLKIKEGFWGKQHPKVALSYNNLASDFRGIGDYEKAVELDKKALKIRLNAFENEDEEIAQSFNNLGASLSELGRNVEALRYYCKALRIRLKLFGKKHRLTAMSFNNIGLKYKSLGKLFKALKYLKTALEIQLECLEPAHPDVALSSSNLGMVYSELGEYKKSQEYHTKALKARLKIFGKTHPSVSESLNNLSVALIRNKDYNKALTCNYHALEINLKVLGDKHKNTAICLNNVGLCWGKLKEYNKALAYHRQAIDIEKEIFGEEHHFLAQAYSNLGVVYKLLDDLPNAIYFQEKALKILKKKFGSKHYKVAETHEELIHTYWLNKDIDKCVYHMEQALLINYDTFGKNHSRTKGALNSFVGLLTNQGKSPTEIAKHLHKLNDKWKIQYKPT